MTDRSADPIEPDWGTGADELLAKGWHIGSARYHRVKAHPERVQGWETRVVLSNRSLGKKLFGFGKDFAEALANAAGQV